MTQDADEPPKISRELTAKYQRAFALSSQRSPDLPTARDLLLQCVLADPGNVIFVETLLHVLRRLGPQRGWWRGFWHSIAFERAAATGQWRRLVHRGLQLVVLRPTDPRVLCGLAEACQQLGHTDVALRYWTLVCNTHPDNVTVQRRCAESLTRLGLFEQARRCWQRVVELDPGDRSAREALEVDARISRPSAAATDPPAPPPRQSEALDADAALSRAQILVSEGHATEAAQLVERAAQASPGDIRLAERLEDLDLEWARERLERGGQRAAEDPTAGARELVEDLRGDLLRREIAVYGARSRRYPEEYRWKLELARSLKQAGNYEEACRTLDEIPHDAPERCEAAVQRGECRQYQRQFEAALASYEEAARAVSSSPPLGPVEQLALYRAGVLAMQLNDLEKAARYLRQLAAVTRNYKDLARHLDKIDSIRHKDGFSDGQLPPR